MFVCVQHIVCSVSCLVCLRELHTVLPVVNCPFLIASLVFSNVYLTTKYRLRFDPHFIVKWIFMFELRCTVFLTFKQPINQCLFITGDCNEENSWCRICRCRQSNLLQTEHQYVVRWCQENMWCFTQQSKTSLWWRCMMTFHF